MITFCDNCTRWKRFTELQTYLGECQLVLPPWLENSLSRNIPGFFDDDRVTREDATCSFFTEK